MDPESAAEFDREHSMVAQTSESEPLLGGGDETAKKPFYRARPLWLVPFAITAALVRGMTVAPRIEVFTQLSCNRLYGHHDYNHTLTRSSFEPTPHLSVPFYYSLDPLGPSLHPHHFSRARDNSTIVSIPASTAAFSEDNDEGEDPRRLPSARCLGDPAVQAGAARLQTIMTTTMGLLSALTTGWWGHFGERHGRTKVLAVATFGLFLTDLTFILVSTPSSPLSSHGHKFLYLAPIIEGLLGGWSTLQSATSAYLSDCTSSGSRAFIFSRFSGVFYFGFSVGPSIGGYLIRNPIWAASGSDNVPMVTTVFWVAIICSFINFILVLLVFPESLDKMKQEKAALDYVAKADAKGKRKATDGDVVGEGSGGGGSGDARASEGGFLSPLAVFLPVVVFEAGVKKRKDWSLTFLGAALFGFMLSNGVHQIKYLYAEHVYGWGAEQLSYYISFIGGARAVFLLFLLPVIIRALKPKLLPTESNPSTAAVPKGKKPKPTKAHLAREISFDLILTRCSLMLDILSNTFVALAPMPSYKVHTLNGGTPPYHSKERSQALFVFATTLSSLGSGSVPAIQSLALCILQVRALDAEGTGEVAGNKEEGVGALFGALAVLQATGQMILGPMLFGLVYSGTVAAFPKAVFMMAGGILLVSLIAIMLVRGPAMPPANVPVPVGRGKGKKKLKVVERGRSRVSKDLRVGAMWYGSTDAGSSSLA